MMTDPHSTTRLTQAEEAYVLAVFREVARIAARTRRAFDADDIASEVALTVVGRPEAVMASYPDPATYARSRTRHAGISFDRRERSQRGEGTRLYESSDGQLQPGRRGVSTDASGANAGPLSRVLDQSRPPDVEVTERMVASALLQRCSDGLAPDQFHEVWLIDGCGYTVQEVATLRGQRRETLSRRLNQARKLMRRNSTATYEACVPR